MQMEPMNALVALMGDDVESRATHAGADLASLTTNIAAPLRQLRSAFDGVSLTDQQRVALVRGLMKNLYSARHVAEVVFVGEVCRAEVLQSPVSYRQLGKMLRSLTRMDELKALASADLGPSPAPEMVNAQYQLRLNNGVGPTVADYEREWGPVPGSLEMALADLRTEAAFTDDLDQLCHALMVARKERVLSKQEMLAKLAWGRAAGDFLFFLSRFRSAMTRKGKNVTLSAAQKQIVALADEAERMFGAADLSAMHQRRDEGRSVLIAEKHAGSTAFNRRVLLSVGLPDTLIAGNSPTKLDTDGPIRLGLRGDFRKDFMKLVKIVKKQQRMIRIFPDGPAGERWEMPFMGTKVSFGLGGPMLAWHSNAAVFTSGSTWRGGRLSMTISEGPVVDRSGPDGGDREAFDQAFYTFYAAELEKVAMGPPEDIVCRGGIWGELVSAYANTSIEKV